MTISSVVMKVVGNEKKPIVVEAKNDSRTICSSFSTTRSMKIFMGKRGERSVEVEIDGDRYDVI